MKRQKSLSELIFEDDRILKEEEEDEGDDIFGDDDEGGDDEGGDEEEGDDEGGDEEEDEDEEGGDDEEDDDDDGGDDEDQEDEAPAGPSDDTIDGQVNNLLADFEDEAVTSAEQAEELQGESVRFNNMHKYPVSRLLYEGDDSPFDVSHFANNVARVIDNYQTLMDVEKMIFDKAKDFIEAKYGEIVAKEFESIMDAEHQMSFVTAPSDASVDSEDTLPVAVGAMTPA